MSGITLNLKNVTADLKEGTRLVAISKYHPAESIQEAYDAGQRIFGESHVQELMAKQQTLPADIEWHFIGHVLLSVGACSSKMMQFDFPLFYW